MLEITVGRNGCLDNKFKSSFSELVTITNKYYNVTIINKILMLMCNLKDLYCYTRTIKHRHLVPVTIKV